MTTCLRTAACAAMTFVLLSATPAAMAQRSSYQMFQDTNRMLMNRVNGDMKARTTCEELKRKGSTLPASCAVQGASTAATTSPAATRFSPVAGDASVKNFADSLGNTPEERAQILQLAGAGKELFAQKYKGKGWDNTLAGAMTFFIVATHIVTTDAEPAADAERALFDALNATLAQSDIARASNADKTALYNVLLASAGLPLVVYVEGKQSRNDALVKQARAMADGFSNKLFNMASRDLAAMLGGEAAASVTSTPAGRAPVSGGAGIDGRYDCQMAALQFDGVSYVTQYRPTGMWFAISGNRYSAQSGGGTIQASADVVSFRGGAYAGWSGARRGEAIVFRKNDHANPRAGESIKSGDFRCGRRSG